MFSAQASRGSWTPQEFHVGLAEVGESLGRTAEGGTTRKEWLGGSDICSHWNGASLVLVTRTYCLICSKPSRPKGSSIDVSSPLIPVTSGLEGAVVVIAVYREAEPAVTVPLPILRRVQLRHLLIAKAKGAFLPLLAPGHELPSSCPGKIRQGSFETRRELPRRARSGGRAEAAGEISRGRVMTVQGNGRPCRLTIRAPHQPASGNLGALSVSHVAQDRRISRFRFHHRPGLRRFRIRLHDGKQALIRARLGKRMRLHGFESLSEYCQFLRPSEQEELTHVVDSLATRISRDCLRNQDHFEFLVNEALPSVVPASQEADQYLERRRVRRARSRIRWPFTWRNIDR